MKSCWQIVLFRFSIRSLNEWRNESGSHCSNYKTEVSFNRSARNSRKRNKMRSQISGRSGMQHLDKNSFGSTKFYEDACSSSENVVASSSLPLLWIGSRGNCERKFDIPMKWQLIQHLTRFLSTKMFVSFGISMK